MNNILVTKMTRQRTVKAIDVIPIIQEKIHEKIDKNLYVIILLYCYIVILLLLYIVIVKSRKGKL